MAQRTACGPHSKPAPAQRVAGQTPRQGPLLEANALFCVLSLGQLRIGCRVFRPTAQREARMPHSKPTPACVLRQPTQRCKFTVNKTATARCCRCCRDVRSSLLLAWRLGLFARFWPQPAVPPATRCRPSSISSGSLAPLGPTSSGSPARSNQSVCTIAAGCLFVFLVLRFVSQLG
jgi:hypothetical protein